MVHLMAHQQAVDCLARVLPSARSRVSEDGQWSLNVHGSRGYHVINLNADALRLFLNRNAGRGRARRGIIAICPAH